MWFFLIFTKVTRILLVLTKLYTYSTYNMGTVFCYDGAMMLSRGNGQQRCIVHCATMLRLLISPPVLAVHNLLSLTAPFNILCLLSSSLITVFSKMSHVSETECPLLNYFLWSLFFLVDLHCYALPSFICLLFLCLKEESFSPNREKL